LWVLYVSILLATRNPSLNPLGPSDPTRPQSAIESS
jgi:hypothetical protein